MKVVTRSLIVALTGALIAPLCVFGNENLSHSNSNGVDTFKESTCNHASDQESCFQATDDESGLPCQWCIAGAIPSECMSPSQAAQLPSGVFNCQTPGSQSQETSLFRFDGGETVISFADVRQHSSDDEDAFCDSQSDSISGYVDIKGSKYDKQGENKHLFFWMFEKRNKADQTEQDPSKTPFILWLTGGPGCSSTLALLTENGPCSVNQDGESTSVNPFSWTESAHVLWLDQPAGVGFSYGEETDTNEGMVSEDAFYFLQAFFQKYPQYAKNPFFVVGESYAGHYVPAIAHRVWEGNHHLRGRIATDTIRINLQGIAIGNGLTNPEEQYKWYPEMVYNNSHGIKVVSEDVYETMKEVVPRCTELIHTCNKGDSMIDTFACQSAFIVCNMGLTSPYQSTGLNPYDIRKECEKPPLCYDMSHITKWLNSAKTKKALHVDTQHSHSWQTCNFGINMKFHTVRTSS